MPRNVVLYYKHPNNAFVVCEWPPFWKCPINIAGSRTWTILCKISNKIWYILPICFLDVFGLSFACSFVGPLKWQRFVRITSTIFKSYLFFKVFLLLFILYFENNNTLLYNARTFNRRRDCYNWGTSIFFKKFGSADHLST